MSAAKLSRITKISGAGTPRQSSALSVPVDKKPNAPRSLDDIGQKYWREYATAMFESGQLFETDLSTLEDLCFWESLKHRGRDELPNENLFMEYKDPDTGALTHTQPHAAFSNLKSIQGTILSLRAKLGLTVADRSGLKIVKRGSEMERVSERRGKDF